MVFDVAAMVKMGGIVVLERHIILRAVTMLTDKESINISIAGGFIPFMLTFFMVSNCSAAVSNSYIHKITFT